MAGLLTKLREIGLAFGMSGAPSLPTPQTTALASGPPDGLLVGRTVAGMQEVRLPFATLNGMSRWCQGASGGGKSAQGLAEELQLITRSPPMGLVKIDAKSESAPWLSEIFIPATLASWPENDVATFFETYRAVSPFDSNNLPALNPLTPAGVVPALQAREIAVLIAESLAVGDGAFGPRMTTILIYGLLLALDVGGLSLLEVRSILTNRHYVDGLLSFAKNADVRDYFMWRFPKESAESIQAVVSRLDLLLLSPDMMRSLAATSCADFESWVNGGVTVIDTGNAPRGAEYTSRFWMGIFVRGVARAILGRRVTPETQPVAVAIDEWWTALDSDLAVFFSRLVALARAKKAGLWLTNQHAAQVRTQFPELAATLANSCGSLSYFRQSREDATGLANSLPLVGRMAAKRGGPAWDLRPMTPDEERRALVIDLEHLPERVFWFHPRKLGQRAVKLVAPTVKFAEARAAADRAPLDIREACRGYRTGHSQHDLDEVVARRRAQMAAVAGGRADMAAPDWDRRVPEIAAPVAAAADTAAAAEPIADSKSATPVVETTPRASKRARRARKPATVPSAVAAPVTVDPPQVPRGGEDEDLPFLG